MQVIFLTPDVIHLQDLSDWTYQGWLLSDYLRGLTTNGYQLKDYPVPNSMVTIILGLPGNDRSNSGSRETASRRDIVRLGE